MNGVGVDMDSRSSPALHAPFATGNLPRVCAEGIVEIHKLSPPRGETTSAPRSELWREKKLYGRQDGIGGWEPDIVSCLY